MNDDLFRLVYYSRNRVGDFAQEPTESIQDILAKSRKNNESSGITGALLFNAGCFGQVLEGGRRAIEATFERIQRDPRHGDVALLDFGAISDRSFHNWAMAFIGTNRLDLARYAHIATDSGFDPSRMSGDQLYDALKLLAHDEENI